MPFMHVEVIEVRIYGKTVGAIASDSRGKPYYAFEYAPSWLRNGYSISPLHLPLTSGVFVFDSLAENTWYRLPAAIADALPDRFGNNLIDARLAEKGVTRDEITALDRLAYTGDRAMGALEFRPSRSIGKEPDILDFAQLVKAAKAAIRGSVVTDSTAKRELRQLLSVGTSAGGARAKAVINLDPVTGVISSGQRPEKGKESWLLKFDGVGDDSAFGVSQEYGRIEYAYSLMAKAAGIHMTDTRLFHENGRAHFMTKRFDRKDPASGTMSDKIHMQSLCAMDHIDYNLIHTNLYDSLIAVIHRLGLPEEDLTEAFRRMAFNYLAMNCDDHAKNFAFLMDEQGKWRLAPAFDVTFAYNSKNIWLREHLMGIGGKFADIGAKEFERFAEKHEIPYSRKSLNEVKRAVALWPEFAEQASLSKASTDIINERLSNSI
ncbi:MAG: type II toxin-antitoxin system HipA family toxin [Oscillospiraceae bacterium]|nr:type II toxin-antitoxin system HipA family toxin [Oscillospiraceae bacterium]